MPAVVPAIVTVALFAFVTSWNEFLGALVMLSRASTFTLPLILASARAETSLGGTDWGMLQAGITISIIPCIAVYLLLQRYYVSGPPDRSGQMTVTTDRAERDGDRTPPSCRRPTARSPVADGRSARAGRRDRRRPVGRPRPHQPRAHAPARVRPARPRREPRRTSGSPRARSGTYQALGAPTGLVFPFLDTDVYKWLEAVGWELGRGAGPRARRGGRRGHRARGRGAARRTATSTRTSRSSAAGPPYRDLPWGHELYCVGHLVQAGIAWHRALGDDRLLDDRAPGRRPRSSRARAGRPRRDRRASRDRDGPRRAVPDDRRAALPRAGRAGWSTCAATACSGPGASGRPTGRTTCPSATPPTVAGHAVRQLYLDCGAVDVAVELGDRELLDAVLTGAGTT